MTKPELAARKALLLVKVQLERVELSASIKDLQQSLGAKSLKQGFVSFVFSRLVGGLLNASSGREPKSRLQEVIKWGTLFIGLFRRHRWLSTGFSLLATRRAPRNFLLGSLAVVGLGWYFFQHVAKSSRRDRHDQKQLKKA